MKGAKPAKRGSAATGSKVPKTVEEYLAGVPEPARGALSELRAAIRSALPREAIEIISYRMPAFKHQGMVVWYAAFSKHCSLFPTASVIEAFKQDLKDYKISRGTIQFTPDKPLPAALVKKIVRLRLAMIERRKKR